MELLKNLCKIKANSLLESVVALSIISVCLYIAIMVYANVFSPKTTVKFFNSQNKIYEAFFLRQVRQDSLLDHYTNNEMIIEEDIIQNVKKITIKYTDSVQAYPEKTFYISRSE